MRFSVVPVALMLAGMMICAPRAQAQFAAPATAVSASVIPSAVLMQPEEMNQLLKASEAQRPLVLQVGSRVFFAEAHIPGSKYVGSTSQPAGMQALEAAVAGSPKDRAIVLYCGCCPWDRCPNVGPAFKRLQEMGFTHVKVIYFANNFGDDWVGKGYPVERGN